MTLGREPKGGNDESLHRRLVELEAEVFALRQQIRETTDGADPEIRQLIRDVVNRRWPTGKPRGLYSKVWWGQILDACRAENDCFAASERTVRRALGGR